MGTITGTQILLRAATKSHDQTNLRWPSDEALLWINDAQREIVNILPKANPKRVSVTLGSDSRQDFGSLGITDGLSVIDVVRNISTGRALTKRSRAEVDDVQQLWHVSTGTAKHWFGDERDPKAFYVWERQSGASVELIYSANPTDLATIASTIALDDIYANAIQFFVLASFYSKDSNFTRSAQWAAFYWNQFAASLGARDRSVKEITAMSEARSSAAQGAG